VQFGDAIKNGFLNYANFRGVASRSEFWYWTLFTALVSFATSFLDTAVTIALGSSNVGIFNVLASLALLVPGIAVAVRRFHDAGFSAWWYSLPQVGALVILGWFMVSAITFIIENLPSMMNGEEFEAWLMALADPSSTAAGDLAYMLLGSGVLPSFLTLLFFGFAAFVFNLVICVLPTRTVEAGNRHNKPKVAPFTIAG
jgi:uncharacterized membrane protein YhaH (DUF805 family)